VVLFKLSMVTRPTVRLSAVKLWTVKFSIT
jgi:hypothetical protein